MSHLKERFEQTRKKFSREAKDRGTLPTTWDSRTSGIISSVKNQNPYGTCWAHASIACVETTLKKNESKEYDLSENNLVVRHGFYYDPANGKFNDGGNGWMSSAYLLRWDGPLLETQDPYPNDNAGIVASPARHVQNVRVFSGRSTDLGNDTLKQAVMQYGALHVSYYHGDSYMKKSTTTAYYCNTSYGSNHAVTLIGWDDNYSKSNFATTPAGNGAFLVKNSWGTGWGDSGYFYVSYYDKTFARGTCFAFPQVEAADNYDEIVQYDPYGNCGAMGGYSTKGDCYCANVFKATKAGKVAAVGFWAEDYGMSYDVMVYVNCTSTSPTSGTLALTQSGTTDTESTGFQTVALTSPVAVAANAKYALVIRFKSVDAGVYPLVYETQDDDYAMSASANAGESMYSRNGTSWSDLTSRSSTPKANFCIKGYLKYDKPVTTHTVTFNLGTHGYRSGGGALVQTVNDGAAATAPTVTANAGYNWTGWDKAFSSVKSDLTVNATYSLKSYTITYANLKGATNPSGNPSSYTVEDSIVFAALPNVKGYLFNGWIPASISLGTTGNKTVTAQWLETIDANEALDNTMLAFSTGGDASWFGQASTTHDGTDALQSGVIGANQTSWIETTVTGPGEISFWWYADCEGSTWDYLFFSIDDVQTNKIGGTSCSWTRCRYDLPAGSHTLRWTYRKDGSVDKGLDAGFLDQVVWTPAVLEEFPYVVQSGKAVITGYNGASRDVTVPLTLGGYAVSGIAANAFSSCGSLERLVLPGRLDTTNAANKWGLGISSERIWVKRADYAYWSSVLGTSIRVLDPAVGSVTVTDLYSAYGGFYYRVNLSPKDKSFLVDAASLAAAGIDVSGGVTASLLNATGRNGIPRFESYLLGLDADSDTPAGEQILTEISFDGNGLPVITCTPKINSDFVTYTTLGKASLADVGWKEVTDANRASMKFFKIRVDVK